MRLVKSFNEEKTEGEGSGYFCSNCGSRDFTVMESGYVYNRRSAEVDDDGILQVYNIDDTDYGDTETDDIVCANCEHAKSYRDFTEVNYN